MSDQHLDVQAEYWNNIARCIDDEVAVNHWVDEQNRPVDKALFSEVADYLVERFLKGRASGSVLEIGCGNGLILKELRKQLPGEWSFYGCDISQGMLNKTVLKEATYVCSDARNMPLDENKFDLIYLHSVTQYFDNEAYLRAVIDECMRLLKSGGGLCLMDVPVTWYVEFMRSNDLVPTLKRAVMSRVRKRGGMLLKMATRMRKHASQGVEVVNGVRVPIPMFKGYYADPEVFRGYETYFGRYFIEVQMFRSKPLVYKRFRFNVVYEAKI